MAYVIAEPCVDVMDQACVDVCPVDCIHFEEGKDRMLYIEPDECIDCGAVSQSARSRPSLRKKMYRTNGSRIRRLTYSGLTTKTLPVPKSTRYGPNKLWVP